MSLTIVAIDKAADKMIVISDKRETIFRGKEQWFGNDESIKHHSINEKLCLMPGSVFTQENQPDKRLALLLQFSNLPTAQLRKIIEQMDRRYTNVDGQVVHDHVILSGLTDQNTFFILGCQPDGSFTKVCESPGSYQLTIATNGEHLQQPAMEYLAKRINDKGDTLLAALKKTVKYVSSIEKTVSPSFIYTIIKKQHNVNSRKNCQVGY